MLDLIFVLVCSWLQSTLMRNRIMNWEYIISGIVGLGLLVYLMYALLKPEKF
jgi:K+-transporting ATPase KdpF subunit